MSDLVSVITASYNSASYIEATYESLSSQTYHNWEWIVTDDNSADNTFDVLSQIAQVDCRVQVVRLNKNSGAAVARNCSMDRASGSFYAFLDADDYWMPEKLERQIRFMKQSEIAFSFTTYGLCDGELEPTGKEVDAKALSSINFRDLLAKRATVGCSTVVLCSSFVGEKRMRDMRRTQDYVFWLDLLRDGGRAFLFRDSLTKYRVRSGSISRNKFLKASVQWQVYRDIEKLPVQLAAYYFVLYAYHAINRR